MDLYKWCSLQRPKSTWHMFHYIYYTGLYCFQCNNLMNINKHTNSSLKIFKKIFELFNLLKIKYYQIFYLTKKIFHEKILILQK